MDIRQGKRPKPAETRTDIHAGCRRRPIYRISGQEAGEWRIAGYPAAGRWEVDFVDIRPGGQGLHCLGFGAEPSGLGGVEAGGEGAEDALVVGVEPVEFGAVQEFRDQAGGVDVAEGEHLEA